MVKASTPTLFGVVEPHSCVSPSTQRVDAPTEGPRPPLNQCRELHREPDGRRCRGLPNIRSNLGEPAGVMCWERDFLLALAVDALDDFSKNTDEEKETEDDDEK